MGVWRISSIKSSKAPKHFGWQVWRKRRTKSRGKWVDGFRLCLVSAEQKPTDCKQNDIQKMHVEPFQCGDLYRVVLERLEWCVAFLIPGPLHQKGRLVRLFWVRWGMLYNFVSLMFLMGLQSVQLFHLPLCSKWNEVEPNPEIHPQPATFWRCRKGCRTDPFV